ncbi:MAG: GHKL domain-containing protein [Spirochaetales bacterium]|nr:GHKL domain-containing protein [Spirochaetales bacterium]
MTHSQKKKNGLFILSSPSVPSRVHCTHYNSIPGAPAGITQIIPEDSGKFLIGSHYEGIFRFDGLNFSSITLSRSISYEAKKIHSIIQDPRQDCIWAATHSGILKIETAGISLYQQTDGLPANNVHTLCLDPSSGMLLAGTQSGIACFKDGAFHRFDDIPECHDKRITALCHDTERNLWCGTNEGVFTKKAGETLNFTEEHGLPSKNILCFLFDENGMLWCGTDTGLFTIKGTNGPEISVHPKITGIPITCICIDSKKRKWVGSFTGISVIENEEVFHIRQNDGLLSPYIATLYPGPDNSIWAGYQYAGLSRITLDEAVIVSRKIVTGTMVKDGNNNLWYASNNELCVHDGKEEAVQVLPGKISCIMIDSQNHIWVATEHHGIFVYASKKSVLENACQHFTKSDNLPSDEVYSLLETHDNTVIAGLRNPGSIAFINNRKIVSRKVPQQIISRLFEDSKGRLWYGGYAPDGLACIDGTTGYFFNREHGLDNEAVLSIMEDHDKMIWIGTHAGIFFFDEDKFHRWTPIEGIDETNHQTAAAGFFGTLYFGTKNGLFVTDKTHIQRLSAVDGIPGNGISGIIPQHDNSLIVSTYNGIVVLKNLPLTMPKITITSIKADQEYAYTPVLTIGQTPYLKINWQGVHLASNKFSYSYCLEGHDTEYRQTWRNNCEYHNCKPGKYTFTVYAVNRSLIVSEEPAKCTIIITAASGLVSSHEYELLFKNLNIGHLRFQLPGPNIIYVNRTILSMLGYSDAQELITKTKEILSIDHPPEGSLFDYILHHAGIKPIEARLQKKTEETVWVTIIATKIQTPTENEEFLDVMCIDTTERKNIELELQKNRKQLEEMVEERTQELTKTLEHLQNTQKQLLLSEKMAALGQLIAGIAHEINSPLSAIRSSVHNIAKVLDQTVRALPFFFQLLSVEELNYFMLLIEKSVSTHTRYSSREEREFKKTLMIFLDAHQVGNSETIAEALITMRIYTDIEDFSPLFTSEEFPRIIHMAEKVSGLYRSSEIITTATTQASNVISALKHYSRTDSESARVYTDIIEGLETVLTLYHNQIKYEVEVVREYKSRPVILCFPEDLIHVWMNLINNALHAMHKKGKLIIGVEEQGKNVAITVSDTGKGIPPEIQKKIFEPFFTTKPRGEGTGLGLDIVNKIVEKHNGEIHLSSKPGMTTFTVILPNLQREEESFHQKK